MKDLPLGRTHDDDDDDDDVCKVFCPEVGLSLDMHYQGSTYLSLLDKRKE